MALPENRPHRILQERSFLLYFPRSLIDRSLRPISRLRVWPVPGLCAPSLQPPTSPAVVRSAREWSRELQTRLSPGPSNTGFSVRNLCVTLAMLLVEALPGGVRACPTRERAALPTGQPPCEAHPRQSSGPPRVLLSSSIATCIYVCSSVSFPGGRDVADFRKAPRRDKVKSNIFARTSQMF